MRKKLSVKTIAVCILLGLLAGLISACSNSENSSEDTHSGVLANYMEQKDSVPVLDDYFIEVGYSKGYYFMYDRYTKIMYTQYYSTSISAQGTGSALTVLLNADGSPMTLDDWNNLEPDSEGGNK